MATALREEWERRTPLEAIETLKKPDVMVTNSSDKDVQIPKISMLNEQVLELMMRMERGGGAAEGQGPSSSPSSKAGGGGGDADELAASLSPIFAQLKIEGLLPNALLWCQDNGADSLEELRSAGGEAVDELVASLQLKKVKALNLRKAILP